MMQRHDILGRLAGWPGLDALTQGGAPMAGDPTLAGDNVQKGLALLWRDAATRPIVEWLLLNTTLAPPPPIATTGEATALLAARHHERQRFGEDIIAALRAGEALLNAAQPPKGQDNADMDEPVHAIG